MSCIKTYECDLCGETIRSTREALSVKRVNKTGSLGVSVCPVDTLEQGRNHVCHDCVKICAGAVNEALRARVERVVPA